MRQRAEGSLWDLLERRRAIDHPVNIHHTSLVTNKKSKGGGGVHSCACVLTCKRAYEGGKKDLQFSCKNIPPTYQ